MKVGDHLHIRHYRGIQGQAKQVGVGNIKAVVQNFFQVKTDIITDAA